MGNFHMSNITKNQHYVPRLLIRNFALKDKVWTYDDSRDVLRSTKPEGVLSENFFYDKDNQVENFLCTVEGLAASKISQILANPTEKIPRQDIDLLRFILVQAGRTPGAYETAKENLKSYTDSYMKQQLEILGHDPKEYEGLSIALKDEKDLLRLSAVGSALNWPLLRDLEPHVFINSTPLDFVLSDNPSCFYNWHLKDEVGMYTTGLTKFGVHIFLPISNRLMLTFYDSRTYKVGNGRDGFTKLNTLGDVKLLNLLQFRNRKSSIIFTSNSQTQYVKDSCQRLEPDSLFQNNWDTTEPVAIGGGKLSAQHFVWRSQLRLGQWLSVVKVKRKANRFGDREQDRDPKFVAEFKLVMKNLETARAHHNGGPLMT
jgi:hypothetical protein